MQAPQFLRVVVRDTKRLRESPANLVALYVLLLASMRFPFFVTLAAALLIAGCGSERASGEPAPTPTASTQPAAAGGEVAAKAKQVFEQRCTVCHGSTGQGDGVASANLDPKPRQYSDTKWQASVTDEYIEKIIKFGGAAVGKSAAMPNNPDLDPAVVTALKDIVRSFDKK